MNQLEKLIERIIERVNINLREQSFNVGPFVRRVAPLEKLYQFYAFYGLTFDHKLHFTFKNSSLAGSYFLGQSLVEDSVLYKTDVRGDELKHAGDVFRFKGLDIPLHEDEIIHIKNSFLAKTLVHNFSHDPETPDLFHIVNSAAMPYANIHGSPTEGCFLGPFATADLTTIHDCVLGPFAYVQVGELDHTVVEPGQIWIHGEDEFDFGYRFEKDVLDRYIVMEKGEPPRGLFMDFVEGCKEDFRKVFSVVPSTPPIPVPEGASLSLYSVVKGETRLSENVLVAQRAYLDNAWLGKGSNAQENCFIVNSRLDGFDITAHGGKIINTHLATNIFVGFNAFLRGTPECLLEIGEESIVMPHTIIDLAECVTIPPRSLIWGYIRKQADVELNTYPIEKLSHFKGKLEIGGMRFMGSGEKFVKAFTSRIEHVLEVNGAYYEGRGPKGHAQKSQQISFNTIQPYPAGPKRGIYPAMDIRP